MKRKLLMLMLIFITFVMLVSCGASRTLTISTDKIDGGTFSLIDSSTRDVIAYNSLRIDGQDVYGTYAHSSALAGWGVAFAFEEGQIIINGGTRSFNGTRFLAEAGEWKYTLVDGVLDILSEK